MIYNYGDNHEISEIFSFKIYIHHTNYFQTIFIFSKIVI